LAACFYAWLAFIIRLIALFWPFSIRSQRHLAGALTLLATFMILMQSIGELSWRDVLAIVPLVAILYVYVGYFARPRKASSTA